MAKYGGQHLPEIVGFCDHTSNTFKIGVVADRDVRSYKILTENGNHISRNKIDLKHTSVQFEPKVNILSQTKTSNNKSVSSTHAIKSPPAPPTNPLVGNKHVDNRLIIQM